MNTDRINQLFCSAQELAQADLQKGDQFDRWFGPTEPTPESVNRRFAELIVHECATYVGKLTHVYPHQAELTKSALLKQFGIQP
jgi:hypothetical protein